MNILHNYNYVHVIIVIIIRSAPTWNLRKARIAQRKLGIPSLVGKVRIVQVDSKFALNSKFALRNPSFAQIPSWSGIYNYNNNYGAWMCAHIIHRFRQ